MTNKVLGGGALDGSLGLNPTFADFDIPLGRVVQSIDENGTVFYWLVESTSKGGWLLANGLYANPTKVVGDSLPIIAGSFIDGFTLTKPNQVGIDSNGDEWKYIGDDSLPVVVAPNTDPSASGDFKQVISDRLINNLSTPHIFDTVHDFKSSAIEFPDGKSIHLRDRGADFIKISGTGTADSYGIIASDTVSQSISLSLNGKLRVKAVGATGLGKPFDDTAAIQYAMNLSLDVHIDEPSSYYFVTDTITLNGGQSITGFSKSGGGQVNSVYKGIYAEMDTLGKPIFQLGDGVNPNTRKLSIKNLKAYCLNGSVIKARYFTEADFYSCEFRSRFYHCIDSQQSYLFNFNGCSLGSSGTVGDDGVSPSYAWVGMDNSNGWSFDTCRMSGGSDGGVADIGKSYTIGFRLCVVESSKYGIHIGKNDDPLISGNVNGVSIDTCQFESVQNSIDAGRSYSVNGFEITNYYTTNPKQSTMIDASIVLGRVDGLSIDVAQFNIADNSYPFIFLYNQSAAGQGSLANLSNSSIKNVIYSGVSSGYEFNIGGFINNNGLSVLSKNDIEIPTLSTGKRQAFTSERIICSNGTVPAYIQLGEVKTLGYTLEKVELLACSGGIDGRLVIGYSGSQALYFDAPDLSLITITDGYADITSYLTGVTVRATDSIRIRHFGGSLAGSFILKITYKS